MSFSAQEIAKVIEGSVEGDRNQRIDRISRIEDGGKGTVTFLANPKYEPFLYTTTASVVVVEDDLAPEFEVKATLIRVKDAYRAFATLQQLFQKDAKLKTGIEDPAYIGENVQLGKGVYIGAFAYVDDFAVIGENVQIFPQVFIGKDVSIGSGTVIHPGARICYDTKIGNDCIIHAGAVIGSDGFGFAFDDKKAFVKIPQAGNVILEDNVEVGANTTIDRAALGSTIIRKGVKLDNLIQVAHNVEIDQNTGIAAQTGISGSTKIGKNCLIGGQVGIVGHLTIGNDVRIAAKSGVGSNIGDGEAQQGAPSFPVGDYKRSYVLYKNLPEIEQRITKLEQEIKASDKT